MLNRVFGKNLLDEERNIAPESDPGLIGRLGRIVGVLEVLAEDERKLTPVVVKPFQTVLVEVGQLSLEDHLVSA